ncbi:MAG: hypothetical protein JOZ87_32785 [Chloroflexi bacterium]|nr:hypothetical protein [Chloroflexota bacterium]
MLDLIPRIHSGRGRPVAARSAGRRILVWTGRILAVLLGLALLGAGYESVSEAADARADPGPAGWSTWVAIDSTSTVLVRAVQPS